MSNRKKVINVPLDIIVSNQSSDDENSLQGSPESRALRRHLREPRISMANMPGTSGPPTSISSVIESSTRKIKKTDRDLFWSLLNNPRRTSFVGVTQSMPRGRSAERRESGAGRSSAVVDIQHILASKKVPRCLNCRLCKLNAKLPTKPRGNTVLSKNFKTTSSLAPQTSAHAAVNKARRQQTSSTYSPGCSTSAPTAADEPRASSSSQLPDVGNSSAVDIVTESRDMSANDASLERDIESSGESANASANASASGSTDVNNEEKRDNSAVNEVTAVASEAHNETQQESRAAKRKREAHVEENDSQSFKELNQSLVRLLECPVCLEWIEPPMSQCRRGHLVCTPCRARLASCPVCRTAFSSVRNRPMELVSEMLRYPCRHGCGREVRLRRLRLHEGNCVARPHQCPVPACAARAPLPHADLVRHFQSKHLTMMKIGRKHKFSMKVNCKQHDNFLVVALHELFHVCVDVDIQTWGVMVYVAYIGPKRNANNFTYKVTINCQHQSRKLMYTRATHSDVERASLNVNHQDCFHLNLDQALNFLRFKNRHFDENFLDFNIKISERDTDDEDSKEDTDS